MTFRRLWVAAALALLSAAFSVGAIGAPRQPPPGTIVSAVSPYSGCSRAPRDGLFANSEVEPSLAVDPRHPRRLIVAFQQDRYSRGAARGLAASFSADAGRSWQERALPFSVCASGATTGWLRASDPFVSIGGDGRIYAIGVGGGVAVSTSIDGRDWTPPLILARSSAAYLTDKPTVTADPSRAGLAYALWQRYLARQNGPPIASDTVLSITHDGGRSWSRPRVILGHSSSAGDVASQLLIDRRRELLFHLAYWQAGGVPGPGAAHVSLLLAQRSGDGGRRWSRPVRIARIQTNVASLHDPASGDTIRTGVPTFAIDATNGVLFAAWQDSRFSSGRIDQAVLARSLDRGRTWRIGRLDAAPGLAFLPTVAAQSGIVAVGYYLVSTDGTGADPNTQFRVATSTDGGRRFLARALGPPFAARDAPLLAGDPSLLVPPGLFLGDYVGVAVQGGRVWAAFATANHDQENPTDLRVASITPG